MEKLPTAHSFFLFSQKFSRVVTHKIKIAGFSEAYHADIAQQCGAEFPDATSVTFHTIYVTFGTISLVDTDNSVL